MLNEKEFPIAFKTLKNLEGVLADEVRALGGEAVQEGNRIVHCRGNLEFVYKANLHLRTALRVLIPIAEFYIRDADSIYTKALQTNWSQFLDISQTFAIDPNVHSDIIRHSNYASVKLKDAIADFFTKKYGHRPNVNPDRPDVLFNLHIDNRKVTISLDSSGESLNRREYRKSGAKAPLNEVLAAGMILLTGWKGESDFYNPMCGSGTLALEATMIAQNLPAGFLRKWFGFMSWKNFDETLWKGVNEFAQKNATEQKCQILASDADSRQLKSAAENLEKAGFSKNVKLQLLDFMELKPIDDKGILVLNPPYGERMEEEDFFEFYKQIGNNLKRNWSGHGAWIISSNREALKRVGLKASSKFRLMNGSLECDYCAYELFSGKRKDFLEG